MPRPGDDGGGGRPRPALRNAARRALTRRAQAWVPGPGPAPAPAPEPPQVDPYDPSADPTLQRIRAFGAQRLAQAQARAIAARTQAEADYRDVQAQEAREQVERPRELVANLSKGNLGYSSVGASEQSNLARALTAAAAQSQRAHQERLSGIAADLSEVEQEVASDDIQAQEEAAERLRDRLGDLDVGGAPPGGSPRPGTPRGGARAHRPTARAIANVIRARQAPRINRHRPSPPRVPGRRP